MLNINEDSLLFFIILSSLLLLFFAGFFVAFIQFYRHRQLVFENQRKERERAFSEELIRSQLEIKEGLMRQISDELHDNIGQSLVVAKMQLSNTQRNLSDENLHATGELIGRTLQELRNMSRVLNGEYILREGLFEALKKECAIIDNTRQISCSITGAIHDLTLSSEREIILFRCVQELLSNAIKHADATEIRISMIETEKCATITVSDNGIGLPSNSQFKKGLGIDNLHKRVELLSGKLLMNSEPNLGTEISITLSKTDPSK